MSDSFGDISGINQARSRACRVAYTINNMQPVICTIIGDQPLFYMDYHAEYDDEVFDAAELRILQGELQTLKHEIELLENAGDISAAGPRDKIADFLSDAHEITAVQNQKTAPDIVALKTTLGESRLAKAYLEFADQHKIVMKYSDQIQTAHYDREAGLILINPHLEEPARLLLAVQELRRHWQHRQGALINPLLFHPDNAVLVNRVQVADLITSVIRIAWELQLSGHKESWNYIEASSMADLGRAFAREAYLDFRTINNGLAAASVFEAWFLSERCRAQDKILINQMLADYKGYVFELESCEKSITPSLIAALGAMPFGKNYLAEHAATILGDAIFTDVRDRSNANFLWFIKFERSFRETEQELQPGMDPAAEGVRSSASRQKQDFFNAQTHTASADAKAEIVTLYEGRDEGRDKKAKKSGKGRLSPVDRSGKSDGSNVVYLRRWSGE